MSSVDSAALVEAWSYRDVAAINEGIADQEEQLLPAPSPGLTEVEVQLRIRVALDQAEERWASEAKTREHEREARLATLLQEFEAQRARYFREVEGEVVQLTLAIARKILQREAALDPTLLRGLVRVALDRMVGQEKVRIRIAAQSMPAWLQADGSAFTNTEFELVGDEGLSPELCIIETDRGSAHFGIEEQMKGMEQSFRDLLARRPEASS